MDFKIICCTGMMWILLGITIVGCASEPTVPGPYPPSKLGKIGGKIDENPNQMQSILSEYDLTEKEFREAVRTVSSNVNYSRQYSEAFREAQSDTD